MPIHRKEMNISWNNDYGEKKKEVAKTCETIIIVVRDHTAWNKDAVVTCDIKLRTGKSKGHTMNNVEQYACLLCRCRPA